MGGLCDALGLGFPGLTLELPYVETRVDDVAGLQHAWAVPRCEYGMYVPVLLRVTNLAVLHYCGTSGLRVLCGVWKGGVVHGWGDWGLGRRGGAQENAGGAY